MDKIKHVLLEDQNTSRFVPETCRRTVQSSTTCGTESDSQNTLPCVSTTSRCIAPPDCHKVFQRLGHLEAFYGEVAGVQEVVDPLLAAAGVVVGLCLGQLIVMVGKAQVLTPTMNVQLLPNDSASHG